MDENKNILNSNVVLQIKNLHKNFGNNHVLNEFNMTFHQGENLKIMGKSGSGKSVMIKCLMGLMEADSGSISVMQKDISELNAIISSIKTDENTVLGMLLNDSISGEKLTLIITNLEASSTEIENLLNNANTIVEDFNSSEGAYNYIVKDTSMVHSLSSTLKNVNEGTDKFNQNMEALKHNFLTRGYFRKLERQVKK